MGIGAPAWERQYARTILVSDAVIIAASVAVAQIARFGLAASELQIPVLEQAQFALTYTTVSVVIAVVWFVGLAVGDTRDPKIFGVGAGEYKRVVNSTLLVFGAYAIIAYLLRAEIGRGYLLIALPLGLGLLLASRWGWRKRLHRRRARGESMYRALVVGERGKAAHLVGELARESFAGFEIVGAITQRGSNIDVAPGTPVLGAFDDIEAIVDRERIEVLIMVSADEISPERLRRIGWELDRRDVNLIVAASLTDIAGPRIHAIPVGGLPLIHVEYPKFVGRRRFLKRAFDLIGSVLGLVLISPLLLVIAIAVKAGSPGPVLFRQERVGLGGVRFEMLKFRSMVADAEDRLPGLLDQSDGNGVLFKMRDDPRVTRVGRFLRKYSLDELPQLFNVARGQMSLVGPRPPLPSEVVSYDEWAHRRLLVTPGITGLWQVSGRSDLSWEDSIRLDLYYVENWSLVGDILIVLRTIYTVLTKNGAY